MISRFQNKQLVEELSDKISCKRENKSTIIIEISGTPEYFSDRTTPC